MKKTIVFTLLAIAFVSLANQELSFNQDLSIKSKNKSNMIIDVGSGSLYVHGEDIDEVFVNAKIHSKDYSDLDDLQEDFEENFRFEINQNGSNIIFKALLTLNHNTASSVIVCLFTHKLFFLSF